MGLIPIFAAAFLATPAHADLTSVLNASTCCGSGPFGTVTVKDISSTEVQLMLSLDPGYNFASTGAGGKVAFGFNISDSATATIKNVTSPFDSAGAQTITADPAKGSYDESIQCDSALSSNCKGGLQSSAPTSFTFDIVDTGGITDADFGKNANGYYFYADIGNSSGTGVASASSTSPLSSVPEPASLFLFATLLAGMVLSLTSRRSKHSD